MLAPSDFDSVTKGLQTKSDKIRALARHGVKTADIARYLNIRYQHARNVLIGSGLHANREVSASSSTASVAAAADQRPPRSAWVDLDPMGRLTIPEDLLRQAGLKVGSRVYVGVRADGLELLSQKAALARAHAIARKYVEPGRSIVDELIADRRAEALKEEERAS